MSAVLQLWLDEGIVLNVGTDGQPRYKRLMKLPERRNQKETELQQALPAEPQVVATQGTETTNGNGE